VIAAAAGDDRTVAGTQQSFGHHHRVARPVGNVAEARARPAPEQSVGIPAVETKGMLLINKAHALNQEGDKQAAKDILGNLALDPNATFANEHLAKHTLAMIAK
jgi:hypothetical protein